MPRKNMTMLEPFEKNGVWWMPDHDNRVPGTLIFDPKKGITVTLFEQPETEFTNKNDSRFEIIHGFVDGGLKISLLDCHEYLISTNFLEHGVYSNSRLVARQCVIGSHLSNESRFNNFRLSVHNFSQFMCRTGIHPAKDHDIGYAWDRVDPIDIEIDGNKISLTIEVQSPFSLFEYTVSIREHSTIYIRNKTPASDLDEVILGVFNSLKTMLEFSLGYPVPIIQFQAIATDASGKDEDIEVFYSQSSNINQKTENPIQDMLFSFCKRSDEDIHSLVARWHNFYQKSRFTLDVLLNSGVQGGGDKHPEQSFFFLIGSLESLHRGYGKKIPSMPEDQFNKIKKIIFSALPHDIFCNQMRERIGGMNEPSLSQRLNDVLDGMPPLIGDRIICKKVLIKNFVDTRTLISHHIQKKESEQNVLYTWHLTQVLWGITVIYVLQLLDFPSTIIDDIIISKIKMLNAFNWLEEVSNRPTKTP